MTEQNRDPHSGPPINGGPSTKTCDSMHTGSGDDAKATTIEHAANGTHVGSPETVSASAHSQLLHDHDDVAGHPTAARAVSPNLDLDHTLDVAEKPPEIIVAGRIAPTVDPFEQALADSPDLKHAATRRTDHDVFEQPYSVHERGEQRKIEIKARPHDQHGLGAGTCL